MPYNNNAIDSTTTTPNLDLLDLLKQKILSQNSSPPPLSSEARGRISASSLTTTYSLPYSVPPPRRSFMGGSSSSSSSSSISTSTASTSSSSSASSPSFPGGASFSSSCSNSTSQNDPMTISLMPPPPPPPALRFEKQSQPQPPPQVKNYKQTYSQKESSPHPPHQQPTSEDLRRNHVNKLEKETHSLRAKISVLTGEHETYKLRARQKLTAVLDKNSELCSTLQKSEIEFQAIYERLSEVFKDNHELGDRNALLSAENQKLQSLLSAKDQEMTEMKERFGREVSVFRGEIERLCKQKEEMAIFFTNKCNDFEAIRIHQDLMEEKMRSAVNSEMGMEEQIANLKSQLECAERVKNEYLEDIAKLEKKRDNEEKMGFIKEKKVDAKKAVSEIIKMRRESGVLMVKAGVKRGRAGRIQGVQHGQNGSQSQDQLQQEKEEAVATKSTSSNSSLISAAPGKRRATKGLKKNISSRPQNDDYGKLDDFNLADKLSGESDYQHLIQINKVQEAGATLPVVFQPESAAFNKMPHEFELITLSDDDFS
ncbi:unnamed protein product [Orchesella dallaii]|uniref:Uncharacterized protein n=1 Tax=Orchesella dallaii TaxID=48710 RepID=A0ABP1S0F4_9HEXA